MMKFFRKHMKKLLAIFASLILISWLGGSALQTLMQPDPGKGVWAVYTGGEISRGERSRAMRYTEWLDLLGLNWRFPLGGAATSELDLPSWYLLLQEARRMGVNSDPAVVEATLNQNRQAYRQRGMQAPSLEAVAARARVKSEVVYEAARAFTDVMRYAMRMSPPVRLNQAEIRRFAEDALAQVELKAVVYRAEMFEDPELTFPEGEIAELFDKHKSQQRSGAGLSFGYVLPPRVKVQYAVIDPEQIAAGLVFDQTKLEKDANRYWRGHKQDEEFRRPPSTDDDGEAEAATQPADEAGEPEEAESPFYTKWAEAKETAVELTRARRGVERAESLAEWFMEQTAEPWYHAEVASNGYKLPMEAVKQLDHYAQIMAGASASLLGKDQVTIATSDWISPDSVLDVPGLGTAALENPGGRPISFSRVVFKVEGLTPIPTGEDAVGVDVSSFMALYQSCRYPLTDADGKIYIFRPVEIDAERPPHDLSEVRDQVIADLRLSRGYQEAERAAQAFLEKSQAEGLQVAWEADEELKAQFDTYRETGEYRARTSGFNPTVALTRWQLTGDPVTRVPGIGEVSATFIERCFAMRADSSDRLFVAAVPESGSVVVAEWVEYVALSEGKFKQFESIVTSRMHSQRSIDYLGTWLDPRQIKARNQFEFKMGG
ncbi:MAG: hypothetical protein GY842_04645 [bacterium]|nr:hypothetical protein [bacterium]